MGGPAIARQRRPPDILSKVLTKPMMIGSMAQAARVTFDSEERPDPMRIAHLPVHPLTGGDVA
jgi:hypothetical protein